MIYSHYLIILGLQFVGSLASGIFISADRPLILSQWSMVRFVHVYSESTSPCSFPAAGHGTSWNWWNTASGAVLFGQGFRLWHEAVSLVPPAPQLKPDVSQCLLQPRQIDRHPNHPCKDLSAAKNSHVRHTWSQSSSTCNLQSLKCTSFDILSCPVDVS